MKKIIYAFLLVASIGLVPAIGKSQVVMKEYLTENLDGKIDAAVNNGGKALYYKFEYVSTEGARINYKLHLYKDAGMKTPWISYDVLMRNLTWTFYVDIFMVKDGSNKVAAMIFKKDLRWSRVKYSPHAGCARVDPPVWDRYTIGAETGTPEVLYAGLMQNMIMQIDRNIDLNCYAVK
jgi:hypothetical protein